MDQQRVTYGQSIPLRQGQTLRFGGAEPSAWHVVDMRPPKTMLIPLHDDGQIRELETFCGLPDDDNPQLSLYIAENGLWVCEDAAGVMPLQDGEVMHQGNLWWKFSSADPVDLTLDATDQLGGSRRNPTCHFHVSFDEEHIVLTLQQDDGTVVDLGERVHHYLLLTLARRRLHDQHTGLDPHEQGWMALEELSQMLRLDPAHVNIQIFRARQQIVKALPGLSYVPQVVERRVGSVRFGSLVFTIARGSAVEGRSVG